MHTAALILAVLSAIAIILAVTFQKSKSDGFSAAFGGSEGGRFTKGSREEWLDKIAKVSAAIWIIACLLVAYLWYHSPR